MMPESHPECIQAFTDPAAFASWLAAHHEREPELCLKLYKKAAGKRTSNGKKPETRQRRFDKFLAMLNNGEKLH